jgi:hypothetical protein
MKSIRSDYFVLTNTFFFPLMMRYIKQTAPLLKCTTPFFDQISDLASERLLVHHVMAGAWSFFSPDSFPVVGRSGKFKNLYFNLASTHGDLPAYKRQAKYISLLIAKDIESKLTE